MTERKSLLGTSHKTPRLISKLLFLSETGWLKIIFRSTQGGKEPAVVHAICHKPDLVNILYTKHFIIILFGGGGGLLDKHCFLLILVALYWYILWLPAGLAMALIAEKKGEIRYVKNKKRYILLQGHSTHSFIF